MQCVAQSVGRVAGVIDDSPGFPYTPPGLDVLEGGKLTSNNVTGSSHNPLQSFAVASCAVSKPGVLSHQTCSQVSEVQVQVKSQVFEVKSKSSLKSLKRSPSQVLSL